MSEGWKTFMSEKSRSELPFGVILRYQREKRGWSQADLAEKLGCDTTTVGRWESGDSLPRPYNRQSLSQLFGINAKELGLRVAEEQNVASLHSYTALDLQGIEFTVQEGDITTFEADVVALKYAQDFYGADQTIAYKLADKGISLENLRPPIGEYRLVATRGSIGAHDVLFVGVPPLGALGYEQIRGFSTQV